jgi:hypothetical protein
MHRTAWAGIVTTVNMRIWPVRFETEEKDMRASTKAPFILVFPTCGMAIANAEVLTPAYQQIYGDNGTITVLSRVVDPRSSLDIAGHIQNGGRNIQG